MKTLHITNYWHNESGGVATFYRELMKGAERLGRQMRIVAPGAKDGIETYGRFGKIYRVRGRQSRLSPGYWLLTPEKYMPKGSPVRRILEAERPDLVECCDKYTLNYLAALLRRGWLIGKDYRPTVVGISCERMDDNMATYLSASLAAQRFCDVYMKWLHFPMFDHHIAVSEHAAGELREAARGHHVRRGVWVRPMGASCDVFHPGRKTDGERERLRRLAGAPEGSTLLVYAGRLAPEKNLHLLIDTVAELERRSTGCFHLLVAGDGAMRASFEQECDRVAPGAIRLIGYVANREALACILANCDIFIHPNPREPFGIAPLEAMASGLALIAPNSGGVTSYADSSNAWLEHPSAEAFADAAIRITTREDEAAQKRSEARRTAERFDWPRVAEGFFDLYDELHAVTQGRHKEPLLPPSFYSTPGNWRGAEIHSEAHS